MSLKLKCQWNWNVNETEMSRKIKCHWNWNVTETEMWLKLKCHWNGNVTETFSESETFCQLSFSVFWGVNGTPPNTLNLFSMKSFIYFVCANYIFHFFKLFYTTIFWYCSIMIFCACKEFLEMGNEWLLFDINPKTRFSEMQKIPKVTKIKINVLKIFLSDLLKNYWSYYSMEWKNRQCILTSNKISVLILSRFRSLPYWDSRCSDWLSWALGGNLTQQF